MKPDFENASVGRKSGLIQEFKPVGNTLFIIGRQLAAAEHHRISLSEGMHEEAFHTVWGLYHVIYETKGHWFRTPEAWEVSGNFRASMYMRPAAAWAMEMMPGEAKSVSPPVGKESKLFLKRLFLSV